MSIAASILSDLRRAVQVLEGDARRHADILPFGVEALDSRLEGAGLQVSALHEVASAEASWQDDSAALLFASSIAARRAGSVLWVLDRRDLFAPGLYQAGLDPQRIIYAEAPGDGELLAVMEEGLRYGGLAAVVGETKRVSTVATRRLQLAARDGATPALMLRRPARGGDDPFAVPSAAVTRWRVAQAPSQQVPWAGLGRACWHLHCVRQRGGNPFEITVEAADETGCIALPAQLVHRPVAADGASTRDAA